MHLAGPQACDASCPSLSQLFGYRFADCAARLGLALVLLVAACSESPDEPAADAGPPTLEIGTGHRDFEALSDGDSIQIVQGPQGGYHFFGSLRATNINPGDPVDLSHPDNPVTTFEVFVGADRVDAMASSYRQGLELSDGVLEMLGRTVILDIQDDSELDGVTVRFALSVRDADGAVLSDERTLVAIPHPNNQ